MRALLSVYDKAGIVSFAQELRRLDFELLATGGTAKLLTEEGIPVIPLEEVTGFAEMLQQLDRAVAAPCAQPARRPGQPFPEVAFEPLEQQDLPARRLDRDPGRDCLRRGTSSARPKLEATNHLVS